MSNVWDDTLRLLAEEQARRAAGKTALIDATDQKLKVWIDSILDDKLAARKRAAKRSELALGYKDSHNGQKH